MGKIYSQVLLIFVYSILLNPLLVASNEYDLGLEQFRKAQSGNAQAQFDEGRRAYNIWAQNGQKSAYDESIHWLTKAVHQGHEDAKALLHDLTNKDSSTTTISNIKPSTQNNNIEEDLFAPESNIEQFFYDDRDINDYIDTYLKERLGTFTYAPHSKFLLMSSEKNETILSHEDQKSYLVAVTSAVDTLGQRNIQAYNNIQLSSLPIDNFLNKEKQDKGVKERELEEAVHNLRKEFTLDTLEKLLGEFQSSDIKNYLEKIKNNWAQGLTDPIKQQTLEDLESKLREVSLEERKDVFDELMPVLSKYKEVHTRILFPFNLSQMHWLLGEIYIHKLNNAYNGIVQVHDPMGKGEINNIHFNTLKESIEARLRFYDPNTQQLIIKSVKSPFKQRQYDGHSCGVIIVEDLLRRIEGRPLDGLSSEKPGELRLSHINRMDPFPNMQAFVVRNKERINKLKHFNTITSLAYENLRSEYDLQNNNSIISSQKDKILRKRKREELDTDFDTQPDNLPVKKLAILHPKKLKNGENVKQEEENNTPLSQISSVIFLSDHAQHVAYLENAFKTVKNKILVTNYGNLYSRLLETHLFKSLIPEARNRGVTIYFRLNFSEESNNVNYDPIPKSVENYFYKHNIDASKIVTHAKILMIDDKIFAIGSYNWLSDLTAPLKFRSFNRTIVYTGNDETYYDLKEQVWRILRYYVKKEVGEFSDYAYMEAYRFKRFSKYNDSQEIDLDARSKLIYIPTIDEHRLELLDIFRKVKTRIIILSPFVAKDGLQTYQRDFVIPLLQTVLAENRSIYFVCLPKFKYLAEKYLSTLRDKYSNLLHLLTFENIHAKTLIMDGNLIAEGSFNWLCAARDELYFSHKHEATFMLEGPEAAKQIRAFYQTPVGKELIKKFGSSKIVIKSQEENYAHTQKVDAATRIKLRNQYFINQKANVTKDLWINFPFWYQSADYTRTSLIYGKFFEIMASNRPDKKGYCLRINGDYLYKGKDILYFPTIPKAKEAAYNIWLQMYE
mgnify:FL=1